MLELPMFVRSLLLLCMATASAGAQVTLPTQGGQAAFAAIQEIVRILDADPKTDWSRVNLEGLRRHLQDMDEVTMRAAVLQRRGEAGTHVH